MVRGLTCIIEPENCASGGLAAGKDQPCHCTRPSSDPPSSQGISGVVETTGKIREIEVTENNLFYCS